MFMWVVQNFENRLIIFIYIYTSLYYFFIFDLFLAVTTSKYVQINKNSYTLFLERVNYKRSKNFNNFCYLNTEL